MKPRTKKPAISNKLFYSILIIAIITAFIIIEITVPDHSGYSSQPSSIEDHIIQDKADYQKQHQENLQKLYSE